MNRAPWLLILVCPTTLLAADWPQWGGTPSRNMVSTETNLPTQADVGKVNDQTGELETRNAKNLK